MCYPSFYVKCCQAHGKLIEEKFLSAFFVSGKEDKVKSLIFPLININLGR